ncbi:MAG TPA: hypothetical protein DF774_15860 [Rheinheimera sp.]|nr:hypothetical protein [Rheinheimera sp.]
MSQIHLLLSCSWHLPDWQVEQIQFFAINGTFIGTLQKFVTEIFHMLANFVLSGIATFAFLLVPQ